jgi:hypothetical protein
MGSHMLSIGVRAEVDEVPTGLNGVVDASPVRCWTRMRPSA